MAVLLLQECMTSAQRRRIRTDHSLCVVVQAPSPAWVEPLGVALRALGAWQTVDLRDGTARHKRKPEDGNIEIAAALAVGRRVVGISHAPDTMLPRSMLTGADLRIVVGHPTDRVVRRAIRAATGTMPRAVPPGFAAGLDFSELAACIRVGGTPADAVGRLRRAAQSRLALDPTLRDQPDVLEMHGFGRARDWAECLLADLKEFRAGRLGFSALSRTLTVCSEPGLGKTSWVRSLAASAGTSLIVLSLGTVFAGGGGGYLGDIAARISKGFADAKAVGGPVILYLDEIDSLPSRENLDPRHRDYWLPLITLFLMEVETAVCSPDSRVIVIAATNYIHQVDPALLRAGRIHPTIHIPRPDTTALAGILRQHLGPDLDGLDLAGIAALASGCTGADVMAWVRDARRIARTAGRAMIPADLVSLIAPPDPRPDSVLWRTAVHEAGHAVGVWAQNTFEVTLVSILASDQRGGRTETRASYSDARSRAEIEAIAVSALAGRAAEVTLGLELNTGATDDLRIATQAIASLHAAHGLGGSLVHRGGIEDTAQVLMMDPTLRREVGQELDALYGRALRLMEEHWDLVHRVATALLTARQLDAAAFEAIVGPRPASVAGDIRHG
ncbi:AAA family ATPase [Methylobacterium sp. V23]|uniref:AAA family ATPase n=1 Tax=Methylobacterium sp. V23 TaxID=2044878 RepID=UPI0015E1AA44|nr:AAA family ATPase [Methylobacterium sp. V23]